MRRAVLVALALAGTTSGCGADSILGGLDGGDRDAAQADALAPPGGPRLAAIPAGEFAMGDHFDFVDPMHPSDEIPIHTVHVDAFQIGIFEVTNAEYAGFLAAALADGTLEVRSGNVFRKGGQEILVETRAAVEWSRIGWDGTRVSVLDRKEDHPMVGVRWLGAAAYCNWLSTQAGEAPLYDLGSGAVTLTARGFRLPTEAEWEWAGRGGATGPYLNYPWGNDVDKAKANLPGSGDPWEAGAVPYTTPVGFYDGSLRRKADYGWPAAADSYQTHDGRNGFGLHDVAGNVWEWINDWYGRDYYAIGPGANPPGPTEAQATPMPDGRKYRGMRGGNWYNGDENGGDGHSRISNRDPSYFRGPQDPNHPYYHIGFRVLHRP